MPNAQANDPRADRIGWIGTGRMGYAMAERLAKGGADVTAWNRTRAKAEPLAAHGVKIADKLSELAGCDLVFCMVSTWDDVREVIDGPHGLLAGAGALPKLVVECSSISLEGSAQLRALLAARGVDLLAAPVSGNAKVIKAGRLSFVCSGPKAAFERALPLLELIGPSASYVGEGELARIVKICHNVFLGVVAQSLSEITVLAEQGGTSRQAFLEFLNNSVMGSVFTRYKSPALVNLDFSPTFTNVLLRKDFDLGLQAAREHGVPMPVAALAAEMVSSAIGAGHTSEDFATLLLEQARRSGVELVSEEAVVDDGLGTDADG
jgi:3-hydroxyisobutyrate dehydrogenase-like beta-hydroxyacid dehydrogenase